MNLQLKMVTYSALIVLLFVILSYVYQNRADANTDPEVKLEPSGHKAVIWMDIERTNLRLIELSLHEAGFTSLYR